MTRSQLSLANVMREGHTVEVEDGQVRGSATVPGNMKVLIGIV